MSAPLPDGVYKIVSLLDDSKVLEVMGEEAHDGTPVDLWENNDKPHQQGQLTKVDEENGEAVYTIGHPGTGMVMEAPGPWNAGDPVVMRNYDQNGSSDQRHRQWKFQPVSGKQDTYKIVNRRSGLAIDVKDGRNSNEVDVKQYALWDDDGRQQWKLVA